jgi:hypothetical protein
VPARASAQFRTSVSFCVDSRCAPEALVGGASGYIISGVTFLHDCSRHCHRSAASASWVGLFRHDLSKPETRRKMKHRGQTARAEPDSPSSPVGSRTGEARDLGHGYCNERRMPRLFLSNWVVRTFWLPEAKVPRMLPDWSHELSAERTRTRIRCSPLATSTESEK